jgi:phage/plasmid-associated DNA primase
MFYPKSITDENDPAVKAADEWVHQCFCDEETEKEFFKDCSSLLFARNLFKYLRVWSDPEGNNSKSMMVKNLEHIFGKKLVKMPLSVVSMSEKNANIVILQEPENDQPLKEGIIKSLTGGDTIYCRDLFDSGEDITISFNIIMITNIIPMIVGSGNAMRNRLRNWPFKSIWVEKPPESCEEQYKQRRFQMNVDFESMIPFIARGFIWRMVHYYGIYKREGLRTPKCVRESTDDYWMENDVFDLFHCKHVVTAYTDEEETEVDRSVVLMPADMYKTFTDFFGKEVPKTKAPSGAVFRVEIMRRIGPIDKVLKGWPGKRLITGATIES